MDPIAFEDRHDYGRPRHWYCLLMEAVEGHSTEVRRTGPWPRPNAAAANWMRAMALIRRAPADGYHWLDWIETTDALADPFRLRDWEIWVDDNVVPPV